MDEVASARRATCTAVAEGIQGGPSLKIGQYLTNLRRTKQNVPVFGHPVYTNMLCTKYASCLILFVPILSRTVTKITQGGRRTWCADKEQLSHVQ